MERWERVLHLHRLLSLQRFPNAARAGKELAVADRTIRRDIEWMKDAFRAPVEYDPQRRGYFYSEPAFTLPASVLSRSQLVGLLLAAQSLQRELFAPWFGAASSAFQQIKDALPSLESAGQAKWINRIRFTPGAAWKVDRKIWEALCLCLESQETARLTLYAKASMPAEQFLFDPYGVIVRGEELIAVGKERSSGQMRRIRVANIQKIDYSGQNFKLESGFNLDAHLNADVDGDEIVTRKSA